jgi:hypothetical protein
MSIGKSIIGKAYVESNVSISVAMTHMHEMTKYFVEGALSILNTFTIREGSKEIMMEHPKKIISSSTSISVKK